MTLPKNIKIDPIVENKVENQIMADLGDLGSLGTYRTNNTLNQIESRVLKNLTARNKQLVDAIKQDPTTSSALALGIGSALQERSANRQLMDLRQQVRGSEIARVRAKREKEEFDANVQVVKDIVKDLAPGSKAYTDYEALAEKFRDDETGRINRAELIKHVEKEDSERPLTAKDYDSGIARIARLQKAIESLPPGSGNQIKTLEAEIRKVKTRLGIRKQNVAISVGGFKWKQDDTE